MGDLMSVISKSIRILLISEHALVRAGLRLLLEHHPGLRVVAEARPGAEALSVAAHEPSDIILLDLDHVEDRGLTLVPELLSTTPGVRVLLLTALRDPQVHLHAVRLGVMGVVLKDGPPAELWEAIEKVAMGEVWMGRPLIARVLHMMTRPDRADTSTAEEVNIGTVTARERDVIGLVGQGLKNRAIARRLCISEATVRHHLTSIFAKLHVEDRFALALYAYRHGLAQAPCHCLAHDAWVSSNHASDTFND
jgi:two-component system, NarL family, response regulator LiaR